MSNEYKVQLVFPEGGSKLTSSGILPPGGIISLATYLKSRRPDLEVELFDGEATPQREIMGRLGGDLVGLSVTGANYHNALEMAREAKKAGAKVILGGSHATPKHRQILQNQGVIDAVVRGDGEIALYEFLEASRLGDYERLNGVKNLSYRDIDGSVRVNPLLRKCEEVDLDSIPAPDYSLLGGLLAQYSHNFQNHAYRRKGYTRFISLESQKGCAKAGVSKKGRCSFCARIDKGLRRLSPQEFWERARQLCDPDGKTMIWDVSDSFSGTTSEQDDWLKQVAKNKPSDLEGRVSFKIFGRADEMDEESVKYLRQIGVYEVFIGAESGDQRKLDVINKGSTVEDNLQAVRNLKREGIRTYVSFIYGLLDEDSESLRRTSQHAKKLIERGKIAGIGARVLYPIAGCSDHQKLLRRLRESGEVSLAKEINDADCYDAGDLQRLWLQHMTKTNLDEITMHHNETRRLAESRGIPINDENRFFLS